jgi:tetratricopeptide (TPR) repeat protein
MRFGFSADPKASLAAAAEAADKAFAIDPAEPHAHGARSVVWSAQARFEDAVRECEAAVEGSPNDAWLRVLFARVLVHAGDAARGAQLMRDAMQLNPFHPSYYYGVLANALEELDDEDEAVAVLETAIRREPEYFAGHLRLASLHGLAGRIEAANAERAEALRINPRFTLDGAAAFYGSANAAATERFKLGLRKAGWSD